MTRSQDDFIKIEDDAYRYNASGGDVVSVTRELPDGR
jgi:hypothetical protein